MDVFISYANKDKKVAERIAEKLATRGFSYFMDAEGVRGGEQFENKIREALTSAKAIIVVLSRNTKESEWVISEWGYAWATGVKIIPVSYGPEDSIPSRLKQLQIVNFLDIDEYIDKHLADAINNSYIQQARVISDVPAVKVRESGIRYLLFDIDGTVLPAEDDFTTGIGIEFSTIFEELVKKGYELVFITGNDFSFQKKRLLVPLMKQGIGEHIFCFSDGGARAFEFDPRLTDFQEIISYSKDNIMSGDVVQTITQLFNSSIYSFLSEFENKGLVTPEIFCKDRQLNHLDIAIWPLKPSFMEDEGAYKNFITQIEKFFDDARTNNRITSSFEFVKTHARGISIRVIGKTPEPDVIILQSFIFAFLICGHGYSNLAAPELVPKGGEKICRIAITPFKDKGKREMFRRVLEKEIEQVLPGQFTVLQGGETTIDIQIKGVSKQKAIRFLINERGMKPDNMAYWGNEFRQNGNDRPIARMSELERPKTIFNVGDKLEKNDDLKDRVLDDHNGPIGTLNSLKFLLNQSG